MPVAAGRLQQGVMIRQADPSELPAVGDLRVEAYVSDGYLSEASFYIDVLRGLGADGSGEVLVAVDGDGIVGTVMLQTSGRHGEIIQAGGEAEIRALAVAPHARGRGVGRALIAAVTRLACERGVRHLVLLTQTEMRTAQHLYGEAGFQRLPGRDWAPAPGVSLLAFGRVLAEG
jgi:ribosomal protein S18 acetylase RimI-like enzyme